MQEVDACGRCFRALGPLGPAQLGPPEEEELADDTELEGNALLDQEALPVRKYSVPIGKYRKSPKIRGKIREETREDLDISFW